MIRLDISGRHSCLQTNKRLKMVEEEGCRAGQGAVSELRLSRSKQNSSPTKGLVGSAVCLWLPGGVAGRWAGSQEVGGNY